MLDDGFERRLPADVFNGGDTVVRDFLDGYGYEHWLEYRERQPFVSRFTDRGTRSLTSLTAASINPVVFHEIRS